MYKTSTTSIRHHGTAAMLAILLALTLAAPSFADGDKKKRKKTDAPQQKPAQKFEIDT